MPEAFVLFTTLKNTYFLFDSVIINTVFDFNSALYFPHQFVFSV